MRSLPLRIGLVLAVSLALLAGCNQNVQPVAAEPGIDTTISYNATEPATTLIPGNTVEVGGIKVLDALFKGLVEYDAKTAAPHNLMAESIKTSDSKVYTIKLKPGWTFQDGTPVTAKSYVDAWNYTAYSPNKMAGSSYLSHIAGFNQANTDATAPGTLPAAKTLSGLRVVDNTTFEVTLSSAFSTFPTQLGYAAFFPLPASFYTDRAKFEAHPIGDGPFSFVSWTKGKNIVVKRWADYPGDEKVHIGGIEFRFYADLDQAYSDVVHNKLDYLDIAPWNVLAGEKYKADLPGRYKAQPYLGYQAVAFPLYNKQWAKLGARQAISMAIDRTAVINQIFAGKRKPADGLVPPNVQGRATDQCGQLCTYQPAKAKALFDKSGFTGPIELASNVDSGNQAWMEATCASISKALGRPCKFVSTPTLGAFRDKLTQHTMTAMYRSAWVADYPSIEDFLNPLFRTGSASNTGQYTNPAVDKLLDQADSAATPAASAALYQQAERQVLQDMPIVPIFFQAATSAWSTRLTGVVPTQFRELDLYSVHVKPTSSGQ